MPINWPLWPTGEPHSLIGVYNDSQTPVKWLAPSFQRISLHVGRQMEIPLLLCVRRGSGAALPLLEKRHAPWEIWIADVASGRAAMQWKAPETLRGSVPSTHGGFNLHWPVQEQLVYLSLMKTAGRTYTPGTL